ncbi:hypothetical protein G7Y79_00059g091570 [Physcia stellaris]|nr:hypothetical protein G7Y79_00059g091570 [Physcia stellaris]
MIAPKPSRLPIPTPRIIPGALETASVTCPPTPPPTPHQKPTRKHPKPYLTIDDLFEMFAEKRTKLGLLHTKKSKSPPKLSNQTGITSYFRPAANQSKPISQGSKTPNPRSFQQHTPAEPTRTKSIPPTPSKWSEKSAILPYKTPTFSRPHTSEISSISPYKMPGISCLQSMAAPCNSSAHLPSSPAFSHVCRICSGTFRIQQWPASAPTSDPFRPYTSPWVREASSARAQCRGSGIIDLLMEESVHKLALRAS